MAPVRPVSIRETLGPVSFVGTGDIRSSRFVSDSRAIRRGDVFVALRGGRSDGHQFIRQAVESGASAVLSEIPSANVSVPQCIVRDSRRAFGSLCLALQGNPQKGLTFSGVTGTNGKTTTTWLLRSILRAAGRTTGLIGTIEYHDGNSSRPARLTTPDAPELAEQFRRMRQHDCTDCVMELSSHALDQQRCAMIELGAAAFTNLTQDHLDYHGDLNSYLAAKARIAELLRPELPLITGLAIDQQATLASLISPSRHLIRMGSDPTADLQVTTIRHSKFEHSLSLRLLNSQFEIRTTLPGQHNALNVLTAAALAEQLQVQPDHIVAGIEQLQSVPGRMERIDAGQPFAVFVDYAHTPDGISNLVRTCRTLTSRRVLLVFGAGGDRDRLKRPLMAEAAQEADCVIVTSDNPRSECPQRIIDDIARGFSSSVSWTSVVNRESAIRAAVRQTEPGDVVVIAGRGHETTQTIGDRCIGFDDRRVTRRILLECTGASCIQSADALCG